jgi:hypothetical protein
MSSALTFRISLPDPGGDPSQPEPVWRGCPRPRPRTVTELRSAGRARRPSPHIPWSDRRPYLSRHIRWSDRRQEGLSRGVRITRPSPRAPRPFSALSAFKSFPHFSLQNARNGAPNLNVGSKRLFWKSAQFWGSSPKTPVQTCLEMHLND